MRIYSPTRRDVFFISVRVKLASLQAAQPILHFFVGKFKASYLAPPD